MPPSVTTVISLVPPGSMRRRTTSRATPIASFSACAVPLGVGVSTMRVESTTCTSQSRLPVSAERLGELAQPLDRGVDLGRIADQERQPPAGRRNVADVDARIAAKLGRDLVLLGLEPLLQRVALIGLEQQVAAAGEVEAEVDLVLRKPRRPARRRAACRRSGSGSTTARRARRRARSARPSSGEIRASVVRRLGAVGQHLADAST